MNSLSQEEHYSAILAPHHPCHRSCSAVPSGSKSAPGLHRAKVADWHRNTDIRPRGCALPSGSLEPAISGRFPCGFLQLAHRQRLRLSSSALHYERNEGSQAQHLTSRPQDIHPDSSSGRVLSHWSCPDSGIRSLPSNKIRQESAFLSGYNWVLAVESDGRFRAAVSFRRTIRPE